MLMLFWMKQNRNEYKIYLRKIKIELENWKKEIKNKNIKMTV